MYIAPSSGHEVLNLTLMSAVRMLHFLKDWWNFIQIHQYYTMALNPQATSTGMIVLSDDVDISALENPTPDTGGVSVAAAFGVGTLFCEDTSKLHYQVGQDGNLLNPLKTI